MALPRLESTTYALQLPSNGQTVEYRPYVVKEEKAILIAKETGTEADMVRASKNLVRACTFEKIDVDNLTTFDFEYLFLMIRAKSAGETSDLLVTCSSCKHKNPLTINIEDAHIKGAVKDAKELTVELTDTVGIQMSYPKVRSIDTTNTGSTESIMNTIANCIDVIYDDKGLYESSSVSTKELTEFVDSLNSKQFQSIVSVIGEMPTLVIDTSFKCKNCEAENEISLEGLANFF